jgi:hypothetical protein
MNISFGRQATACLQKHWTPSAVTEQFLKINNHIKQRNPITFYNKVESRYGENWKITLISILVKELRMFLKAWATTRFW